MVVNFASFEFVDDDLILRGEITPDTEPEHEKLAAYVHGLKYEKGVFKFETSVFRDKPKEVKKAPAKAVEAPRAGPPKPPFVPTKK